MSRSTEKKEKKGKNMEKMLFVPNARFPFPCICGVPGISYYSRGLGLGRAR